MTVRARIEEANLSKSGKTVGVKLNGQWYQSKNFELQNMVGHTIEGQTSSSEWQGKTMLWLNDYVEVPPSADDAMQSAMAAPPSAPIHQGTTTPPHQGTQIAPQGPQTNKDASIGSLALTKACTAPGDDVQLVWSRYCSFYRFLLKGVPVEPPVKTAPPPPPSSSDFDDDLGEIPF